MTLPEIDWDRLDFAQNKDGVPCARCGLTARGYATIEDRRYCHPNRPDAPDCYSLALWERSLP